MKRTAESIIKKSEFNEYCIALYAMHCHRRGEKEFLRNCIGRYDADIIIKTPIFELNEIYRSIA